MKPPHLLALALLLPLLVGSCSSILKPVKDTSIHHLLEPLVPERSVTGAAPAIAIARPSLPSYLDRQQLVARSGDGELKMNPYHLWAEPLDAAISRITATNLRRLTNSLNIQPVENFVTLDYQWILEIRVARFEPDATGLVVLEATWKLQPIAGGVAPTRQFTTSVWVPEPVSPDTANPRTGQAAAMNDALAQFAADIARAL
ncbi:hypothetical protein BH23VER1_BH23VER1_21150 [soil metagenome]